MRERERKGSGSGSGSRSDPDCRRATQADYGRSVGDHDTNSRSGGTGTRTSAAARARAQARARARAKARARNRMLLYAAVFAVAILVLVAVIKSAQDKPQDTPKDTKTQATKLEEGTPSTTVMPAQTSWDPVTFTSEDVSLISYRTICRCKPDFENLLLSPLDWDLTQSNAKVLIIHTHVSEAYTKSPGEDYEQTADYRSDDENYNMVAIGKRVAQILRASGVEVIHDTNSYEYPNTDYAYKEARTAIEEHLRENPDITLVIDLHRDAALLEDGSQWGPTVTVDGKETARMAFAIGTNCYLGGDSHYESNLALTLKLQVQLEKMYTGITREILISSSSYNQDLPTNFMLVEVGAAGNTFQEAMNAADCLAQGILAISSGTAENTTGE